MTNHPFHGITYARMFESYASLSHEKTFLADRIERLLPPKCESYLDVGPGDGSLMRMLAPRFACVSAVEANAAFLPSLLEITDNVRLRKIEETRLRGTHSFILCSHVLGYIPVNARVGLLRRLATHLDPEGILVIIYNSAQSELYRILDRLAPYTGHRWAKPICISELENPLSSQRQFFVVKREPMPVLANSREEMLGLIRFMSFKDTPLNASGVAALDELVDHYKDNGKWRITIEHELLCISPSRDILRTRPLLTTGADAANF